MVIQTRSALSALLLALLVALFFLASASAYAQAEGQPPAPPGADAIRGALTGLQDATQPDRIEGTLLVFLILTVLSLAPAILIMTTSFTRIIVVLGFLRQAMGTQQSPPNQVLVGLALFLTFFIMGPTYQQVYDNAVTPYMNKEIGYQDAVRAGLEPIRDFMFRQVREKDLALFINIAKIDVTDDYAFEDIPTTVLMPAFMVSELSKAFWIGFRIYIPFLVIDMVVASTLMAMGMMMLPPIFVSLPFKIIVFVLADGWHLIIGQLVQGFA